jgi:hypothetical protein
VTKKNVYAITLALPYYKKKKREKKEIDESCFCIMLKHYMPMLKK